jgi:hypothetical protein
MYKRARKLGLIGAAAGLVLAVGVVSPPATAATTAASCGSLNGLTVTAPSYSTAVLLNAGDKVTATVSPATSTDKILLSAVHGLFNFSFSDAPATTSLVYTAPAASSYSLQWSLQGTSPAPSQLTWKFTSTCSSTAIVQSPTETTSNGKKGKGRK